MKIQSQVKRLIATCLTGEVASSLELMFTVIESSKISLPEATKYVNHSENAALKTLFNSKKLKVLDGSELIENWVVDCDLGSFERPPMLKEYYNNLKETFNDMDSLEAIVSYIRANPVVCITSSLNVVVKDKRDELIYGILANDKLHDGTNAQVLKPFNVIQMINKKPSYTVNYQFLLALKQLERIGISDTKYIYDTESVVSVNFVDNTENDNFIVLDVNTTMTITLNGMKQSYKAALVKHSLLAHYKKDFLTIVLNVNVTDSPLLNDLTGGTGAIKNYSEEDSLLKKMTDVDCNIYGISDKISSPLLPLIAYDDLKASSLLESTERVESEPSTTAEAMSPIKRCNLFVTRSKKEV